MFDGYRCSTVPGVTLTNDGRVLVVEYKGRHLLAEAADKAAVGAVWASPTAGAVFL